MKKPFYINVARDASKILVTWFDGVEKRREKVDYFPTLFVKAAPASDDIDSNEAPWHDIRGQRVYPVRPGNISDTREFMNAHKDIDNFPILGLNKVQYEYISDNFPGDISSDWDNKYINIAYLDIEVSSNDGFPEPELADKEVTAITIKDNSGIRVYGCKEYNGQLPADGKYFKCENEPQLLRLFLAHWAENYPDIVTGWNVKNFDMKYLVNRVKNLFGENKSKEFSPWKKYYPTTRIVMGREETGYEIAGVATLDYMELYKKYGPPGQKESYSLNYICYLELGESKLSYSEYGSLQNLYEQNYEKFIDYNVRDVLLVEKLEQKRALLQLALILAYDSKTNYEDVFYQTRMWDSLIYNFLKDRNIVPPPNVRDTKESMYEGAYVKDPHVGMHEWVVSFDYTSLYPSLMMQFNISPDTIIEQSDYSEEVRQFLSTHRITPETLLEEKYDLSILKDHNIILAANGQFFRNDFEGFLPQILRKMFADRQKYKKLMIDAKKEAQKLKSEGKDYSDAEQRISRYDLLQLCKKVCLNSCYGATGTPFFRYYDIRQAVAVTMSGQLAIKYMEKKINEFLNKTLKTSDDPPRDYVLAVDTDSVYLDLSGLVNKVFSNAAADLDTNTTKEKVDFLDRACQEIIQPQIRKFNKHLAQYVNAKTVDLDMKRESICDKTIWTAKKRYILSVIDSEGVRFDSPQIKMSGIEAVKSSTPEVCRKKIKEAIGIILTQKEEDIHKFVSEFRNEFKALPVEEVSFPRGVNNMDKYSDASNIYKDKTPIHVKGALYYNHFLQKKKLHKKYPLIREGDKIKFTYVKPSNPNHISVISFPGVLPKELVDILEYIDYDMQFRKAFLDPLEIILTSIGWHSEYQSTLF